jgi:hypothetical protein
MTQITATERAIQLNSLTEARCAAQGITFFGLLMTTGWEEFGIQTGDELDRYLAFADYVETYKERAGFKPRGLDWRSRTASEWQAAADGF